MLRRTLLFAVITTLCFFVFIFSTSWSQDALSLAPEQAARLTSWMSSDQSQSQVVDGCVPLNRTKVATMIETRDSPMLVPIIQSWLANMPRDWPFVIWTGKENHKLLTQMPCFRDEIQSGRLNFTRIDMPGSVYQPDPKKTSTLSDLLANTNWFWTQFHAEAEWMLFFQIDSVLCSKSDQTADDWLGYEFVGAPCDWTHDPGMDRLGGNGGLSMRKISALRNVTIATPRKPGDEPEDVWFTRRLREKPSSRWPEREGRPTYGFSMSQGWIEDETIDEAWRPLGLHHGLMHIGDALESDGAGRITNKLHRILQTCPEFLLLRYALDEYQEVDWTKFSGQGASKDQPDKSSKTPEPSTTRVGFSESLPDTQATIEDLSGNMHDLTPILTDIINAGRLNMSNTTTEQLVGDRPQFSGSSDDVHDLGTRKNR